VDRLAVREPDLKKLKQKKVLRKGLKEFKDLNIEIAMKEILKQ
jgi:hypothetical protein